MWNAISPRKLGVATYNFDGKVKHGLSFNIGDIVQIQEECLGWYRGCTLKNKSVLGVFPASYVVLRNCRRSTDGSLILLEDVTVNEVGYVLKEWNAIRKKMFTEVYNKKNAKFAVVGEVMFELMDSRRILISQSLTTEQTKELKSKISKNIDWGNKLLGLDVIPRINDEPVDGFQMNPLELFQLHLKSISASKDILITSKSPSKLKTSQRLQSTCGSMSQVRNYRPSTSSSTAFHILLTSSCLVTSLEHDFVVHLRIFDAPSFKPFTENYVLLITKSGKVVRPDGQGNSSVLFKDLGRDDRERDAYLVAKVFRVGSLKESDNSKLPTSDYRRPYGCGVVRITEALSDRSSSEESHAFNLKILSCSEQDFVYFHEYLMRSDMETTQPEKTPGRSFCMIVSLRLFFGEVEELLEKEAHYFKGVAFSDKLGFPDIIKPNSTRNDLYITLVSCDFEKSGKSSQKNIEARVVVMHKEGEQVQKCLCIGSGIGSSAEFKSSVLYHCNNPKWNETFKLSLPVECFFECHLRVEFRHCSQKTKPEKKFLGFSFLKLSTSDVTTLHDDVHNLLIYKCDESKLGTLAYLDLPDVLGSNRPLDSCYQVADREVAVVETLLCSTKLTQNIDIVKLLQWNTRSEDLKDILEGFTRVEGHEIVKFLPDILDSLFDVICKASVDHELLALSSLVQVFEILEDDKFECFKSVFEIYLANNFSGVLVYRSLIRCMCRVMEGVVSSTVDSPSSPTLPTSDHLGLATSCFKVFNYISKCIVQSRLLFKRAHEGCEDWFTKDLLVLVQSLCRMLSSTSEAIAGAQATCLQNLPCLLLNLLQLLKPVELGAILNNVVKSLPSPATCSAQTNKSKLKCLHSLSSSSLFQEEEWRRKVIPTYTSQLRMHMFNKQNLKLATKILTDILLVFHESKENGKVTRDEVQLLLNNLLIPLMGLLKGTLSDDMGSMVACFVSLLTFFDDDSYTAFVSSLQSQLLVKETLVKFFVTLDDLMTSDVIPRDWFVARMSMNRTFLRTLQFIATTLCDKFLHSSQFDAQLWELYFQASVTFAVQPSLQLDTFSAAKAQKIKSTYGDMRITLAYQLSSMWNNLGDNKIHFIPRMIGPFLEVSLIGEAELRATVLPIFFAMIECQQQHFGNFQSVEDELINKLDAFLNEHKGDSNYQQLFETIMMDKLKDVEEDWKVNGGNFIRSVGELLERLLDYRAMLETEENMEIKMICTVNLLNFYKDEINRREMYVRYVYKLHDLHLASSNHVEAAFSLLLHAELLDWSNDLMPSGQSQASQFQWNRKEELYFHIISEFDKGKCWEYGLPLCEELAVVYKERIKYDKLSRILQTQSEFYEKILHSHRLQPSYFRVAFYGRGFPLFLRNKEFVYRGNECEKLSSFQNRMTSLFPGSTNLIVTVAPSDDLYLDDGMYIQINSVRPVPEISSKFLPSSVSESVRCFHKFNNVDDFILDRPYHKGDVDQNNEFMSLHIERSNLKTSCRLPGILRWSQVQSVSKVHLCPVEVAIDTMQKMNFELQALVVEYSSNEDINLNPLTMRLQGVIDAAVQGGVKKYQQVFLAEEFLSKNPQFSSQIIELQGLLEFQVRILDYALTIHGKLAPPEVLPLHNRLQELFHDMKGEVFRNSAEILPSTSQSARSSTSSLSGLSSTTPNRNSGSFNGSEHIPAEQSLFKQRRISSFSTEQKSQTTSRWYTDELPSFSRPKNDVTSRASALLNFKSNRKNSSTPTLLRSDSNKRLVIREDSIFFDRPASDQGGKSTLISRQAKLFEEKAQESEARSERSSPDKCSTSLPPVGPPVLPPKRFSGFPKPPLALPKPPPPPPPPSSNRISND